MKCRQVNALTGFLVMNVIAKLNHMDLCIKMMLMDSMWPADGDVR